MASRNAKSGPIIEANTETATDKIRSQGLTNGELLDLIKIFVAKIGEAESKSLISTYLLDRQFGLLAKTKPSKDNKVPSDVKPTTNYESDPDEEVNDEAPASYEIKPELIIPLDIKTGK